MNIHSTGKSFLCFLPLLFGQFNFTHKGCIPRYHHGHALIIRFNMPAHVRMCFQGGKNRILQSLQIHIIRKGIDKRILIVNFIADGGLAGIINA